MTDTMTETETKFKLTIHHDDDSADLNPNEQGSPLFKLHSFNSRHMSYSDPNLFLSCSHEDDDGVCGWGPSLHDSSDPDDLIDHEYVGPEGYFLSYFEHGQCRWGLEGTMSGIPDFRWDGTSHAGFLEVVVPDDEREWWDGRSEEDRLGAAESFVEEYTFWCNGDAYGYTLEQVAPTRTCDLGFSHEPDGVEVDSCWGFLGFDYFQEEVRGVTFHAGATEENTEIVDKCFGSADYGRWFVTEEEGREIRERIAENERKREEYLNSQKEGEPQ